MCVRGVCKVGIYRMLRFWIPFPDQYTDLPISYRDLGTLILLITPVMWDVWFELQSRWHPLSHTATVTRGPRPNQPLALALHPTSATTNTATDMG